MTDLSKAQPQTLQEILHRYKDAIREALPRHMSPERVLRVAQSAYNRTPALKRCTPLSVASAIVQASQLGLECDTALGHAYLVPYKQTCQLIVGYKGLIDLAFRSGKVSKIEAHVVRERDEFDFAYGSPERLYHKPSLANAGEVVAVWAKYRMKDGTDGFIVLSVEEVEAVRKRSPAKDHGPWVTDWPEQAKKTAIRRLCKYLPLSSEIQTAIAVDERAEVGVEFEPVFDVQNGRERAAISAADIDVSESENRGHDAAMPQSVGEIVAEQQSGDERPKLLPQDFTDAEKLELSEYLVPQGIKSPEAFGEFLKQWDGSKDDLMAECDRWRANNPKTENPKRGRSKKGPQQDFDYPD